MRLVVGRIGRAQGVRGEVTVEVRTDAPEERFSPGALVHLSGRAGLPPQAQVDSHRWQNGRLILRLAGIADRTAAESLRGAILEADVDVAEVGADEFHDQVLIGLQVCDRAGAVLGSIREVVHLPGQDLLAVDVTTAPTAPSGASSGDDPAGSVQRRSADLLIPFVAELVPVVDVEAGHVVVDLPHGLGELRDS